MPNKTDKKTRQRIVELRERHEDPDVDETWSHRDIADEVGVHKTTVWRVLDDHGMTSSNQGGDAVSTDAGTDAGGDGVSELTPDPPTGTEEGGDAGTDAGGDADDDVVEVPCDKCGDPIPIDERHVSQTIECPHCGEARLVTLRE